MLFLGSPLAFSASLVPYTNCASAFGALKMESYKEVIIHILIEDDLALWARFEWWFFHVGIS